MDKPDSAAPRTKIQKPPNCVFEGNDNFVCEDAGLFSIWCKNEGCCDPPRRAGSLAAEDAMTDPKSSAAPRQPGGPDEARFMLYCACKECTVAIQADTPIRFFCEACAWWRTSGPHFHDCDHTMPGKQGAANGQ